MVNKNYVFFSFLKLFKIQLTIENVFKHKQFKQKVKNCMI